MIFDNFRDLYFQFFHVLLFIPVQSVGDEKTTGNETISEEWVSKSHTRRFLDVFLRAQVDFYSSAA